jgi:Lon protease-like protein
MTDLPGVIPIFPLPNVVLFPGVPLPLHIFEARYREMVRDAASDDVRIIGMALLRGDWRKDYYGNPQVFSVGCAGRMTRVQPLPDGRYNILLHGLREFVIDGEISERSYRLARVRWRPASGTALAAVLRTRLVAITRRYVEAHGPEVAQKLIDDATVTDELLVNFFCYALELDALEKQALLEATSLESRAERLCEVVEFALGASGTAGGSGSDRYH